MTAVYDPLMPKELPPAEELLEVEMGDVLREARRLVAEERIDREVVTALHVGLGCLRMALREPDLRGVGASLRVTVGNRRAA